MSKRDTEYATIPFFDYHDIGDKECGACYTAPKKQSCSGLLHNHFESTTDDLTFVVLWRCDGCGGSHQDSEAN